MCCYQATRCHLVEITANEHMTSFKINQKLLFHDYLCSFKFIKNTIKMLTYPAAARNQDPILNTLKQIIPDSKPLRALEFGEF